MDDRRTNERHSVFGGNAEIEAVYGRGQKPKERARIVNWSRGGLLLKVKSPRRRFLIQKLDPVLFEDDRVLCKLRLPPRYEDVVINAEVRHVKRDDEDADTLQVGVQFDEDAMKAVEKMARVLEPRSRSGRHKKVSRRTGAVSSRIGLKVHGGGKSGRSKKVSGRVSGRSRKVSERTQKSG